MSWLLFMDESGHDHRTMPYEVRGGVALHASELWPFVQDMQRLELASFAGDSDCQTAGWTRRTVGRSPMTSGRGWVGFSSADRRTRLGAYTTRMESCSSRTPTRRGEGMKKGGNAVGTTRKQSLGRASEGSVGDRRFKVKGVLPVLVQGRARCRILVSAAETGKIDVRQEAA